MLMVRIINMSKKLDDLNTIWQEHGFPSADRLWTILRQNDMTQYYSKDEVRRYIAGQKVAQLHHRPTVTKHSHITTTSPGVMYCIDLLDMSAYARGNGGIHWLLLCIDVFSRVAAIVPLKNKTAPTTAKGLEEAFDQFGLFPKIVLSDQGSEFKGATSKFLADNNIIHRLAEVGDHRRLGLVDRFSGVVKGWIAKYQTYHQTDRYVDALPKLVKNYNNAPHSSLEKMTPNEAWEFPVEARDVHYRRIQKKLIPKSKRRKSAGIQIGDSVRVLKLKKVFDKGYHVKYSLTIHKVVAIKGLNYVLDNGRFYRAARLLVVQPPEEEEAEPVEDVAQRSRRQHRAEVVLKADGVEEKNVRRSLRERKPAGQLEHEEYGRVTY